MVPAVPKELAAALEAGLNEDRRLRPNALGLATAVYRSAEPQPVDLSDAVHPTVLPELLTRRRIAPDGKGAGVRIKLLALRRRIATSRWSALSLTPSSSKPPAGPSKRQSIGQHLPPVNKELLVPHGKHAGKPVAVRHGKHADGPVAGRKAGILAHALLPAIAAAAAGMWWLSGAGQLPWPGTAATGSLPAAARPTEAAADGGTGAGAAVDRARQEALAADPAVALQGLAALRDHAFSSGRLELLADVNAPGSAAAAADELIAAQLRPTGHRLAGFTSTLAEVATEQGATQDHAVVRVVSTTSGYSTVNVDNSVLATGEPSRPQPLRLVLVSVDGQWRVSEILAAE